MFSRWLVKKVKTTCSFVHLKFTVEWDLEPHSLWKGSAFNVKKHGNNELQIPFGLKTPGQCVVWEKSVKWECDIQACLISTFCSLFLKHWWDWHDKTSSRTWMDRVKYQKNTVGMERHKERNKSFQYPRKCSTRWRHEDCWNEHRRQVARSLGSTNLK